MARPPRPRLFLGFDGAPGAFGGGSQANAVCAEMLRACFDIAGDLATADLQLRSFSWKAPTDPPRVFLDHGSFADASFWAFTAPQLLTSDTIFVSSSLCVR